MNLVNSDLVSIITPAFCSASFIGEAINSVISQTYSNWEMIITDDCSPDDTIAVIRKWALVEPRVRLIAMDRNVGPALARNAALQNSQGRWIAFLDSDDLWLPDKLERSISHAQKNKAVFIYTGYRRISSDGSKIGRYINVPLYLTYNELLGNTAIVTSTVILDRSVLGDVRMKNTYYDDFDCWLQILKRGHLAVGLNEDLMRYRVLKNSVSRNKHRSARYVWRAYRDLERLSLISSLWYFSGYAIRGLLKYRRF